MKLVESTGWQVGYYSIDLPQALFVAWYRPGLDALHVAQYHIDPVVELGDGAVLSHKTRDH